MAPAITRRVRRADGARPAERRIVDSAVRVNNLKTVHWGPTSRQSTGDSMKIKLVALAPSEGGVEAWVRDHQTAAVPQIGARFSFDEISTEPSMVFKVVGVTHGVLKDVSGEVVVAYLRPVSYNPENMRAHGWLTLAENTAKDNEMIRRTLEEWRVDD